MDKVAVLVPCYNEEKTIGKVINDFRESLPNAVIYVYDNNSTDETVKIAEELGSVVRLSSTYFAENKRPFHNFGNSLVWGSINSLFKTSIKDIMTGYRAFSYQFVKSFPVMSKGFEIETEMTIFAVDRNMKVDNVVIEYRDRPKGSESKLNTFSDGLKVIGTIAHLYKNYRPFGFFSLLAIALALISSGFFVPVLVDYINTGVVDRFPTLIVCGFVMVLAILLFSVGIILATLRVKDRHDFEYRLQEINMLQHIMKRG